MVLLCRPKGIVLLHLTHHCCRRALAKGQELAVGQALVWRHCQTAQVQALGRALAQLWCPTAQVQVPTVLRQALALVHCQEAQAQVPTVQRPQALQPAHQMELGLGR